MRKRQINKTKLINLKQQKIKINKNEYYYI